MIKLDNETHELNNDALDHVAGGVRFMGIEFSLLRSIGGIFTGPPIGTAIGGAIGGKVTQDNDAA